MHADAVGRKFRGNADVRIPLAGRESQNPRGTGKGDRLHGSKTLVRNAVRASAIGSKEKEQRGLSPARTHKESALKMEAKAKMKAGIT